MHGKLITAQTQVIIFFVAIWHPPTGSSRLELCVVRSSVCNNASVCICYTCVCGCNQLHGVSSAPSSLYHRVNACIIHSCYKVCTCTHILYAVYVISSMESRLLLHLYIIELMLALSIYDIKFIRAHIYYMLSTILSMVIITILLIVVYCM